MKKILCPTDFSDTAQDAIAYAAKLAQVMGAELILLNVQSALEASPAEILRGKEMTIQAAQDRLEQESREVTRMFHISCYAEVEKSTRRLSSVISEKAHDYDLIVMGTEGPKDLLEFLTGSHTYNAILASKTPLLMVPKGYMFSEIRSVVLAFDYLKERKLPIRNLIAFIKAVKCKLIVLQVLEEAYSQEVQDELKELQFIINTTYGEDIKIQYDSVRSSDIATSINSYVLKNEPDVLALCSVHHNLFGKLFHKSVIRNITTVGNYPVLIYHE